MRLYRDDYHPLVQESSDYSWLPWVKCKLVTPEFYVTLWWNCKGIYNKIYLVVHPSYNFYVYDIKPVKSITDMSPKLIGQY